MPKWPSPNSSLGLPGTMLAYHTRLPLLAYVSVDTFEQLSCKFGEEAVFFSHQARLRTRTWCVSSSARGVVGGPVWFGFNGRLRCVTQVCLTEPEVGATQAHSEFRPHEAEISGLVQWT